MKRLFSIAILALAAYAPSASAQHDHSARKYVKQGIQLFSKGDLAVAYGYAGAGTGEKAWKIPAAWRAIVQDGKIGLWQVYADTKIQFERMGT